MPQWLRGRKSVSMWCYIRFSKRSARIVDIRWMRGNAGTELVYDDGDSYSIEEEIAKYEFDEYGLAY